MFNQQWKLQETKTDTHMYTHWELFNVIWAPKEIKLREVKLKLKCVCLTVIPFMTVCVCVCLKINVPLRPSSQQSSKLPVNGAGETSAGARDNQSMSMNLSGCHDMSLINMTSGRVQTVMFSSPRALESPSFERQVHSLRWVAWVLDEHTEPPHPTHTHLSVSDVLINCVSYSFIRSIK